MLYYRGTDTINPMSDWGHAMFADNYDNAYTLRDYAWSFDGSLATPIEDLKDQITAAWNEYLSNGYFNGFTTEDNEYYLTLSADEVYDCFNPADIVDSAGAYDSVLVCWLCEAVLMPNDIYAITTNDGAVVFDENLINRMEK